MVLLSIGLLRSARCCSRAANLTLILPKRPQIIGQRVTGSLSLLGSAPSSSASLCSNGTVCSRTFLLDTGTPVWAQNKVNFHTSAPVRALPAPLLWMILKPLQKLTAIILGRSLRKWWVALPANRRQLMQEWAWQRRWHLTAAAGVIVIVVILLVLTHLDESPVTGRTRLLVVSREQYMELAAQLSQVYVEEFKEMTLPVADARHKLVERLVQILAERNKDLPEVCDVSWSVHVVENPEVNAFVLPDGKVFVFTGMLESVMDVHQLSIVIGHEMAHAILGHGAEQASLSHVVDLLSLVLLTAIWAICPRDSLALLGQWVQKKLSELMFERPYSRKLEAEADEVGLQLAAKACADVRAGPVFWQQMELREQLTGEPSLPEWLSTHPSHRNRYTQLDRIIPEALKLRESCVCPALPALDPRAIFSQSVQVLLENVKQQHRGGQEETRKAHLPLGLASLLPSGLSGALLLPTPPPSSNEDTGRKRADGATPAPTEGGGATADGLSCNPVS